MNILRYFMRQYARTMLATATALLTFTITLSVHAQIKEFRWEHNPNGSDELSAILTEVNAKSGYSLTESQLLLVEERDLANMHFKTYAQMSGGIPVDGAVVRTWRDLKNGALVQMEAHLEEPTLFEIRQKKLRSLMGIRRPIPVAGLPLQSFMSQLRTMDYVRQVVLQHPDDQRISRVTWRDKWSGDDLQREIKVQSRRGVHHIVVSHMTKEVVSSRYVEYPKMDIPALAYPIYEETEKNKTRQQRIPVTLKNLLDSRRTANGDPYASLRTHRYFENMMDPVLGETPDGQAKGYWSINWLMRTAKGLFEALPSTNNSYDNGGVYLEGRFATINLHPDAVENLKGLEFVPAHSSRLSILWKEALSPLGPAYELVPVGAYYGRPLRTAQSAVERVAQRTPDHNPVTYINDGFDEIQVYYAINTLMESLHAMGFSDPELSTRPFHAFLYDPDISMRDNAYYTNDTINFTTYSPHAQNYARDNSTIWHELGHGVMDRLMGDMIHLADTGGLSEGMADFVAQLVIQDVTAGADFDGASDFRIINRTGFNLTNESHDDGEAYGGAMNDILMLAMQKWGHESGLRKMTDLTLEAMRLTRNHPALTANDWFEHMLYADRLGRDGVRLPNEMQDLIVSALSTRNFRLDRGEVAKMIVMMNMTELTSDSAGSRGRPIAHQLTVGQKAEHSLSVQLSDSDSFQFQYPVTLEVQFNGGPLQGAIKWQGEENGPLVRVLQSKADLAKFKLTARDGCDFSNREDGSCVDYAYLLIKNNNQSHAAAKKRFYLRITPP